MKTWLTKTDITLSERLNVSEKPGLWRALAIFITHSGDAPYLVVSMGLLYALGSPEWRHRAITFLIADLSTLIVSQIMKFTFRRPRPDGQWGEVYRKIDPHSFPSGHSSRGGMAAMVGLLAWPGGFGLFFFVWGLLVALSRVMTGVHYLLDALGGVAVGMVVGGIVVLLML